MPVRRPVSILIDKDGNQTPSSRPISDELAKEVPMPTYTILEDPPWLNNRASAAPTASSIYSEDARDTSMPVAETPSPLRTHNSRGDHTPDRFHAHPQQQITDRGPQHRSSKLPIFQQVRSMLHKPSALVTPSNTTKWDELSGEPSSSGKAAQFKPSNHMSPWDGAFKARQNSTERAKKSQRDVSPVSVLQDDELKPVVSLKVGRNTPSVHSPVSPMSPVPTDAPDSLVPNTYLQPSQGNKTAKLPKSIRRKPVSSSSPSASENMPPQRKTSLLSATSSPGGASVSPEEEQQAQPQSRFSWSTLATSVAPGRPSLDTTATKPSPQMQQQEDLSQLRSHFSWSTVNTAATNRFRADSDPPEPPPPIPQHYANANATSNDQPRKPQMQSILSRSRPIQRQEEVYTPPSRKTSSPASQKRTDTPTSSTPTTRKTYPTSLTPSTASNKNTGEGSAKKLPPPPTPPSSTPTTHVDDLLAQESNLAQQRRNIAKAIRDLELVEKASPLEVSFTRVRDAKKELDRLRRRADEVGLEEAECGRAIVRARRKEEVREGNGTGAGLWVRRVTG